jgi:hypothetical protein
MLRDEINFSLEILNFLNIISFNFLGLFGIGILFKNRRKEIIYRFLIFVIILKLLFYIDDSFLKKLLIYNNYSALLNYNLYYTIQKRLLIELIIININKGIMLLNNYLRNKRFISVFRFIYINLWNYILFVSLYSINLIYNNILIVKCVYLYFYKNKEDVYILDIFFYIRIIIYGLFLFLSFYKMLIKIRNILINYLGFINNTTNVHNFVADFFRQMDSVLTENEKKIEFEKINLPNNACEDKCIICYVNNVDTILHPCSHNNICINCSSKIKKCSICRKTIEKIQYY